MSHTTRIATGALCLLALIVCPGLTRASGPQDRKPAHTTTVIRKPIGVLEKEATERVEPVYPPLARAAKVTGAVVVEVTVDETGAVAEARAVSGHPLLKDAAVEAARKWKFKPARLSGAPARMIGPVVFRFTIEGGRAADSDQASRPRTIAELEKEVRDDPGSMQSHGALAMAYAADRRYEDAVAQWKEAIRILPKSAESHYRLGLVYFRWEHFAEAAEAFQASLELDPEFSDGDAAWMGLGTCDLRLGRYEEAIKAFSKSIEISPAVAETYVGLGLAYSMLGKHREAIGPLKHSVEMNANNPVAHLYLGKAYIETDDKESAMKEYEVLKRLHPESAALLLEQIKARWPTA